MFYFIFCILCWWHQCSLSTTAFSQQQFGTVSLSVWYSVVQWYLVIIMQFSPIDVTYVIQCLNWMLCQERTTPRVYLQSVDFHTLSWWIMNYDKDAIKPGSLSTKFDSLKDEWHFLSLNYTSTKYQTLSHISNQVQFSTLL